MSNGNLTDIISRISGNVSRVLVGKEAVIELALVAIGCEGHILIEDVPGVGKTMLARSLALSLGLSFSRIQCTPDLLPSDVTGMLVFNPKTAEFNLRPGPIISNIILVDEINRATPRTQSGLLEAMEERQVTIDTETRLLPRPFLVMATQNPVEFEGTFPLPEAQLDRFLLRIAMGYPQNDDELKLLARLEGEHPIGAIKPVVTAAAVGHFSIRSSRLRTQAATVISSRRGIGNFALHSDRVPEGRPGGTGATAIPESDLSSC